MYNVIVIIIIDIPVRYELIVRIVRDINALIYAAHCFVRVLDISAIGNNEDVMIFNSFF